MRGNTYILTMLQENQQNEDLVQHDPPNPEPELDNEPGSAVEQAPTIVPKLKGKIMRGINLCMVLARRMWLGLQSIIIVLGWAWGTLSAIFSFGNIFKILLLVVLAGAVVPPPAYINLPLEQHFTFTPAGYAYASFRQLLPTLPLEKDNQVGGYYELDAASMLEAWTTVRQKLHTRTSEESENETCSNEANKTSSACSLDEEHGPLEVPPPLAVEQWPATKLPVPGSGTTIVIDLRLDTYPTMAGQTAFVREFTTFLIGQFRDIHFHSYIRQNAELGKLRNVTTTTSTTGNHDQDRFEVIVVLASNGGSVSQYGLLAEQLRRIRNEPGMTLTVCCDEAALSGGYMVASLASPGQLFAAPFAAIGSIGVITSEILNFQKMLKEIGVQPVQLRGGDSKDPISMFGEVRQDQLDRVQASVDEIHGAFRNHVENLRGDAVTDYDYITSGDYWIGSKALKLGLVDRLVASDEYIDERVRAGDRVLKLGKYNKYQWLDELMGTESGSEGANAVAKNGGGIFAAAFDKLGAFALSKLAERVTA